MPECKKPQKTPRRHLSLPLQRRQLRRQQEALEDVKLRQDFMVRFREEQALLTRWAGPIIVQNPKFTK